MIKLTPLPLSERGFAPYGEVIDLKNAQRMTINNGLTTRFHDLLTIDIAGPDGRPVVSVFRSKPLPLPHRVQKLERHPLGSQAFLPLEHNPFLVLVAADDGAGITAESLQLFIADGSQGINFRRNVWHHCHIVLHRQSDFMVVDRAGAGCNLEEKEIVEEVWIAEV